MKRACAKARSLVNIAQVDKWRILLEAAVASDSTADWDKLKFKPMCKFLARWFFRRFVLF